MDRGINMRPVARLGLSSSESSVRNSLQDHCRER